MRQLAIDTGLDAMTINRLFTNRFNRVDSGTVEALCNYFGKDVGDLFEMRKPEDIPQGRSKKIESFRINVYAIYDSNPFNDAMFISTILPSHYFNFFRKSFV